MATVGVTKNPTAAVTPTVVPLIGGDTRWLGMPAGCAVAIKPACTIALRLARRRPTASADQDDDDARPLSIRRHSFIGKNQCT